MSAYDPKRTFAANLLESHPTSLPNWRLQLRAEGRFSDATMQPELPRLRARPRNRNIERSVTQ